MALSISEFDTARIRRFPERMPDQLVSAAEYINDVDQPRLDE